MKAKHVVMLAILDGFGIGDKASESNAIAQAKTPEFQALWDQYPHSQLEASGLAVGLPEGQMGNSEVGHLTLGAGRTIYQDLTRITKDIAEGKFAQRAEVQAVYKAAQGHALHILALLSDGGVHSSLEHVKAAIAGAKDAGLTKVYVHGFLDGRDVPPQSAMTYIKDIEEYMAKLGVGTLATIGGRYYGMDRDKRWERVALAYDAIVAGKGECATSAEAALQASYDAGVFDEFVKPTVLTDDGFVKDGDTIWFCNFRPDRARQLTEALVAEPYEQSVRRKDLYVATMTPYQEGLPVHVVYGKESIPHTLGEVLSQGGYKQLRIAETEKYAHVTYFFNGGEERVFPGEERILVPSPKVATYDMQPEMSANIVTDKVVDAIESGDFDMIILNFANPDMVGHTGNIEATKVAIETVDACLGRIAKAILAQGGDLIVTADHGNAEKMRDESTGTPYTAHTTNPVPCILVSEAHKGDVLSQGSLRDIAPSLLALAGIEIPEAMEGKVLFR